MNQRSRDWYGIARGLFMIVSSSMALSAAMADPPKSASRHQTIETGRRQNIAYSDAERNPLTLREQALSIGSFPEDQPDDSQRQRQQPSGVDESQPMSLESANEGGTHSSDYFAERAYGIGGPWRLRSADAVAPGTLSIRNEFNWSTGYESGDDEENYSLTLDYGIAPMHHLTMETTAVGLGDGAVTFDGDGVNGDWGAGIFYTIAFDGLPSLE